ncbi:MAG: EamA family transporter [Burkholderiales bacterium]|nr:EamA family transporter [Burkholderiales bacterium]
MNKYKQYNDAIIYVILTAISFVYIDKLGSYINPLVSLLFMAVVASIWFNLINLKHLSKMYGACISDRTYLILAFSIGVNWLSSIYAPHYSDPFIYLSIYFIVLAICGFYVTYRKTKLIHNLISCIILIITCVIINVFYVIETTRSLTLGIILGIIGGLSAYIYALSSGKFSKKHNLESSQLLAIRFIPLCVMLLTLIKFSKIPLSLSFANICSLIIMTVISLIIPVYFYQQTIKKLGAAKSSILVAFTPILVFILFSISQFKIEMSNLLVSMTVLIGLILPKIIFRRVSND